MDQATVLAGSYRFESPHDRDDFLNRHFPKRTCTDCPGLYDLPDGRQLTVFLDTITIYPKATP